MVYVLQRYYISLISSIHIQNGNKSALIFYLNAALVWKVPCDAMNTNHINIVHFLQLRIMNTIWQKKKNVKVKSTNISIYTWAEAIFSVFLPQFISFNIYFDWNVFVCICDLTSFTIRCNFAIICILFRFHFLFAFEFYVEYQNQHICKCRSPISRPPHHHHRHHHP